MADAEVQVPMPDDGHAGARRALLRGVGLDPLRPSVRISAPGAVASLLCAARVASLSDKEVYYAPPGAGGPRSRRAGRAGFPPGTKPAASCLWLLEAAGAPGGVLAEARTACDAALEAPGVVLGGGAALEDGGNGAAVCDWARGKGAHVGVAPAQLSHDRGAVAAQDIPAGSDALTIPTSLLFTAQVQTRQGRVGEG